LQNAPAKSRRKPRRKEFILEEKPVKKAIEEFSTEDIS
jgi:hypothetical protein